MDKVQGRERCIEKLSLKHTMIENTVLFGKYLYVEGTTFKVVEGCPRKKRKFKGL